MANMDMTLHITISPEDRKALEEVAMRLQEIAGLLKEKGVVIPESDGEAWVGELRAILLRGFPQRIAACPVIVETKSEQEEEV